VGSELYYYHQDEQLSAALLTDDTGRIRNYYRYDAFGGMLAGESRIGESNVPIGYYQDSNGIWRRANISSGTHGNSLSDTRTNYGYVLLDKDTKDILKFWESIASESYYTQKYLT
jgi:hypothetical protein